MILFPRTGHKSTRDSLIRNRSKDLILKPLRIQEIFILGSAIFQLTGCTITRPALISTTSLGPREAPLGMAHGEASDYYIFGMGPGNETRATMEAAIENAKGQTGADAIINVTVDESRTYVLPFFWRHTVSVTGLLVRYKKEEPPR